MRTAKSIWAELHQLKRRVTGLSDAFGGPSNRAGWPSLNSMFFEIRRLTTRQDTLKRIAEIAGVEYAPDNLITDNRDLIAERAVLAMRDERDAALEAIRARQRACVQTAKERDAALGRVAAANHNMATVARYVERLESLFGGAEILAGHAASSGNGEMADRAMDWLARYESVQSINMEGGN